MNMGLSLCEGLKASAVEAHYGPAHYRGTTAETKFTSRHRLGGEWNSTGNDPWPRPTPAAPHEESQKKKRLVRMKVGEAHKIQWSRHVPPWAQETHLTCNQIRVTRCEPCPNTVHNDKQSLSTPTADTWSPRLFFHNKPSCFSRSKLSQWCHATQIT